MRKEGVMIVVNVSDGRGKREREGGGSRKFSQGREYRNESLSGVSWAEGEERVSVVVGRRVGREVVGCRWLSLFVVVD